MSAPTNTPVSGAREARPSALRRLLARAAARDLAAFVVPGPEVARAFGLDLEATGLRVADTPRHAGVLVLIGALPPGLKRAAAVAHAQMPRPRAILAVGAGDVSPLPEPDVSVAAGQQETSAGVERLRRLLAEGSFAAGVPGFDVDEFRTRTEYACPMHPEVTGDEPGSCPKCGMDLVPREAAGHDHPGHGSPGEGGGSEPNVGDPHREPGPQGGTAGHEESGGNSDDHEPAEGDEHEGHDGTDHGGHEGHGHMDHGDDVGFMSMVAMTRGTPRSSDGLQMEWAEAPFGPFFPGLPGGLSLSFTLDGDAVAGARATPGIEGWGTDGLDGTPGQDLPGRLALLDPLSPVAYRALASRALEAAAGAETSGGTALERIGALERERAASHLGWLSSFGHLLGYAWLETRAGRLQLALLRAADAEEVARLDPEVGGLLRKVARTPLLVRHLRGVGTLPGGAEARGPVARAAGLAKDTRTGETVYGHLDFEPVVRDGDDALARLRVRLAEVEQSLGLVRKAGSVSVRGAAPDGGISSGTGSAAVETPRGAATLRVTVEGGVVVGFGLDTPSTAHHGLIGAVAEGREVADALVGVASLDLSPWGVAR